MKGSQPVTLSPAGFDQLIEATKHELADRLMAGEDIDSLKTIDLQTVASFTGLPLERVTKLLPYIEFGPRSRRVTLADYKAYLEDHKKYPKGWKPRENTTPALSIVQSP